MKGDTEIDLGLGVGVRWKRGKSCNTGTGLSGGLEEAEEPAHVRD